MQTDAKCISTHLNALPFFRVYNHSVPFLRMESVQTLAFPCYYLQQHRQPSSLSVSNDIDIVSLSIVTTIIDTTVTPTMLTYFIVNKTKQNKTKREIK